MYTPKNKILEGLYTNGGEFMYRNNGDEYIGYYHKFFNGKLFTGKTQNIAPRFEIIPIIPKLNDRDQLFIFDTDNKIALFINDPDPIVDKERWNQSMIVDYLKSKGYPTNKDNPRKIPFTFYPNPTKEDYEKTYIIRYFAQKQNEREKFIEISKEVYDKFKKRDKEWVWDQYKVFNVIWTITAETEEQVETINRNVLYLTQRRIKFNGLIAYLRGNYSKFFKSKAQLKLEAAPKSTQRKALDNPIPNTTPILPTVAEIKSRKFFKTQTEEQQQERVALNEELQRKKGQQKPNQALFSEEELQKRTQQVAKQRVQDQPEVQSKNNTSTDTTSTSTSNKKTSRNTGGY